MKVHGFLTIKTLKRLLRFKYEIFGQWSEFFDMYNGKFADDYFKMKV
jgi:hypothetical protein